MLLCGSLGDSFFLVMCSCWFLLFIVNSFLVGSVCVLGGSEGGREGGREGVLCALGCERGPTDFSPLTSASALRDPGPILLIISWLVVPSPCRIL